MQRDNELTSYLLGTNSMIEPEHKPLGAGNEPLECDERFDTRWLGAYIGEEHWHFHRQLLQRYSIVLGPGEFSRMLAEIKNGKALKVEERRDGSAIYSIRVISANERIYVLAAGLHIITAWPPNRKLNEKRRQMKSQGIET